MSTAPTLRRATLALAGAVAISLGAAATQAAHAAPPLRVHLAVPVAGAAVATADVTMTFLSPTRYDASFCIEDKRADYSGAGFAMKYTYTDGSTHWTRTWRNDGGAGSSSCHRAWVDWPPAIHSIEAVLNSDKFGSARFEMINPHRVAAAPAPPASSASGLPPAPAFGRTIDRYAPMNDVKRGECSPGLKPGVAAFRDLLLKTYRGTDYIEGSAACAGRPGGHDVGLAIDWGLYGASKKPIGDRVTQWLTDTDQHGNAHAMARRLGINMLIWHNRIWTSSRPTWREYAKSCRGGRGRAAYCHRDHVHIEFGEPGAYRRTTWWNPRSSGA
jgi:hypothetical protein